MPNGVDRRPGHRLLRRQHRRPVRLGPRTADRLASRSSHDCRAAPVPGPSGIHHYPDGPIRPGHTARLRRPSRRSVLRHPCGPPPLDLSPAPARREKPRRCSSPAGGLRVTPPRTTERVPKRGDIRERGRANGPTARTRCGSARFGAHRCRTGMVLVPVFVSGTGTVMVRTPSLYSAVASSPFAPAGSRTARVKVP